MSNSIELRGVVQGFGRTNILRGLDLDVTRGVFGLLGPNGAGKTTVLRTLATIVKPRSGTVRLLGLNPDNLKERRTLRRRMGYLPQAFGYYPNFTVAEFVEYFALLKEVPHKEVKVAVTRSIERVGLEEHARSKLRTLSGGMLRRAGIAQAIVNEPDVLLLDEPTSGLDPEQRVAFRKLVREIGEGRIVVLSTHLVEDVGAACNDVALLHAGSIVFRGTSTELVGIGEEQGGIGDTPLERGYTAALAGVRS